MVGKIFRITCRQGFGYLFLGDASCCGIVDLATVRGGSSAPGTVPHRVYQVRTGELLPGRTLRGFLQVGEREGDQLVGNIGA